jgi:hypothetical protein
MKLFNQKKASINQSQMMPPTQTGMRSSYGAQNKLNTSFSNMNNQLANKWGQINSKSKAGGLTGRPQTASTQLA